MAIAHAPVNDPNLILAAQANRQPGLQDWTRDYAPLRGIAKEQGRSVVIASHDQRIKDIADRALWLEVGQFQDIVTMVNDPVCGMTVERGKAIRHEWDGGQTFHFCAKGCRDEFINNPDEFIRELKKYDGRRSI